MVGKGGRKRSGISKAGERTFTYWALLTCNGFYQAVYNHWTGLVDWTGGLDWWTDLKNHFYAF